MRTNVRRLRHAKGISQEDLAHEAGINCSYLSELEKGASYPGLEIIAKARHGAGGRAGGADARFRRSRLTRIWRKILAGSEATD
jgi:transcriptional regulator with XRE-family HTH domain